MECDGAVFCRRGVVYCRHGVLYCIVLADPHASSFCVVRGRAVKGGTGFTVDWKVPRTQGRGTSCHSRGELVSGLHRSGEAYGLQAKR